MKPFWTPQSAVLIADPPTFAVPVMLKLLLKSGSPVTLVYAGDRMHPAIRHGQSVLVNPIQRTGPPPAEAVVLACPDGIPDLLRVGTVSDRACTLEADADDALRVELPLEAVLGVAQLPRRPRDVRRRAARRLQLDLREALTGGPDPAPDPADTVRRKYDAQAPFYAGREGRGLPESLLSWCRDRVRGGGRILVAGSGTGRESFALADEGWTVSGIDFSAPMVELARREAARLGRPVDFAAADLRAHEEGAGSLDAVFFTYDVYSFLPRARERIALLARMASWLAPGGVVFLSARRCGRPYDVFVLTLQRMARATGRAPEGAGGGADGLAGEGPAPWGASHTRWIGADGEFHRSFVHVFTTRGLLHEVRSAGLRMGDWRGNHCLLERADGAGR